MSENECILCTKCKGIIVPPVWQCANSHIFCSICLEPRCQICQYSLINPTRNLVIEEVIKNSEQLPCMYTSKECDFKGRIIDLAHHESTCEYADLANQCMLPNCVEKLRKKAMIQHLIATHKANFTNKVEVIDKGKFQVEVFKQINCEQDWKSFEWKPFVYKRTVGDEERHYLLRIWSQEWVLYAQVISLTHESEPIRYLLEKSSDKSEDDKSSKFIIISRTITYKRSAPIFEHNTEIALNRYGYKHSRGDIKGLLLKFSLSNKDFFAFN
ncbi:hypothetical protein SteCoe_10808 [Stentor coeruleus]|uniref:SIAH-type domain-containing protein n=1 Tax=Stentor coeruleus TaxID=5963 RepID=A0A1R2CEU2_9CILI|nr:hypothetical protein SteCoe_10808 [Stentor coeruleus]